jgi:hypothetical protein
MGISITKDSQDQRYDVRSSGDSPEAVASAVKQQCQPGSIKSLSITSVLSATAWTAAINTLKPYLVLGIELHVMPSLFGIAIYAEPAETGAVYRQIQDDARKQRDQRWKLQQELQNKIFEIQQDVTTNRAQTQDKAARKWDEYIRS